MIDRIVSVHIERIGERPQDDEQSWLAGRITNRCRDHRTPARSHSRRSKVRKPGGSVTPRAIDACGGTGSAFLQSTEVYLRADPTEKLEALATTSAPMFKPGRFRAPDKLLAMLKSVSRSGDYAE